MAVVANTTAILAKTSYTPPFPSYTNTLSMTYVGGPHVSSTSISNGPTSSAPRPVATGRPTTSDDQVFIADYLTGHALTDPSYRYAYFLWFVLLAAILIYSFFHHLRLTSGPLGTIWNKFFLRRHVFRQQKNNGQSPGGRMMDDEKNGSGSTFVQTKNKKKSLIFSSNAQITSIVFVGVLSALLCVIGDDYIARSTPLWDLGSSFSKRAGSTVQQLNYNISKSWWTSGNRFGLIAFAMFPLVVLFALKAPPFALLALRAFTHLHADKLMLLHRWTGRIIWLFTALHVALWSVQLFKDGRNDGTGRSVWVVAFIYSKFIWGVVGFVGMTGLIVLSFKVVRKRVYELFYVLHILLTIVTLLGSVLHYPPLWYWIMIAAALWAGERAYRFFRFGWINGWFGGMDRQIPFNAGPRFEDEQVQTYYSATTTTGNEFDEYGDGYGMKEIRPAFDRPGSAHTDTYDKTSPLNSHENADAQPSALPYATTETGYMQRSESGYSQTHHSDMPKSNSYDHLRASSPGVFDPPNTVQARPGYGQSGYVTPQGTSESTSLTHGVNIDLGASNKRPQQHARPRAINIPAGYAHAQLLPSKTIRLTVRLPRPFKWHPGQHVLLYIPEISRWQSHPFSILSVHDTEVEREIVLLVKARKGFTLKLFEATRRRLFQASSNLSAKRVSLNSAKMLERQDPPSILFRAMVDGPFGSAARGRPGSDPTVLIICGGSGVSFGISILQYLCECMASRDSGNGGGVGKGGKQFKTKRVRFVWIVREFAEIAWVSVMLKRCIDMVPKEALQIDIFVTDPNLLKNYNLNSQHPKDEFAPPQPSFAKNHKRSQSSDSLSSQMSTNSGTDLPYLDNSNPDYAYGGAGADDEAHDIIDLTNYEDEEDEPQSEAQIALSTKVQKEGKWRRASRRASRKVPSGAIKPSYPPPTSRNQSYHDASRPTTPQPQSRLHNPIDAYRSVGEITSTSGLTGASYDPYLNPSPAPVPAHYHEDSYSEQALNVPFIGGHSQRPSVANSYIEGSYDRYDPFSTGRGPRDGAYSPSPSMNTFDLNPGDTRSIAGDSLAAFAPRALSHRADSMVLIGDGPDGGADAGIWLDAADYASMNVVAEMTRPGRPKLDVILKEEIEKSQGTVGVGSECTFPAIRSWTPTFIMFLLMPSR